MAITVGRASNTNTETVASATWTDILPTGYAGCEEITIACSAQGVLIAVQQRASPGDTIHRIGVAAANVPDDWFTLASGSSIPFAGSLDNKITRVMVAGNGGTATITWTVTKA